MSGGLSPRLRALNGAGLVASIVFGVRGLQRPSAALPGTETSSLAEFWSEFAAARTLPLAAITLFELSRPTTDVVRPLLVIAGLVQAGDAVIGVRRGNRPMTIAPAAMAAVHLFTAHRREARRETSPVGS